MRFRPLIVPGLLALALASCIAPVGRTAEEAPLESVAHGALPAAEEAAPLADEPVPAVAPVTEVAQDQDLSQEAPSQDLSQEAERVARIRQRAGFLAQQYIEQGDAALERSDFEGALAAYAQALEVMPSSEEARAQMRKVESLMGNRFAQAADLMQDAVEQEIVRRAQARMTAEQFVTDGDNSMRLGEHEQAIESYRRAQTILRYHPLVATDSLDEQIVNQKLDSAIAASEDAALRAEREQKREAGRIRAEREKEQREYRENKLKTLYTGAYAAFQREQYSTAESMATQILLWDPGNEQALEMREIATAARHQARTSDNLRLLRENWIRTFEDIESQVVAQSETIIFDDLKRWREVSQRQPLEFSSADTLETADKQAILARLDRLTIRPRFGEDGEGVALEVMASYLQRVTGINFLISNRVTDELDEDETSIYLDLPERSVRKVLDIIADTRENLRWKIEDGVVKFVTSEEMIGGQVLRMYEVRDLIHPVRDFPGREINVQPSGGLEPFDEDFEEREALVVTEDSLDALIRDNVAVESWDLDPNNSLRIANGTLIVYQTPEVQAKIQKLLDDLREATGIMVDVQARFLTVEDNFLEDIGVDFRGLGSPGKGTNEFFNDFGDATAQATLGQEIGQDTSLGAWYDDGSTGDIKARIENLYDSDLGDNDVLTGSGGLSFQWTYLNDLEFEMIVRAVSKSERVELVTAPRLLVFNTARANLTVLNQVAYVQDYDVEIAQAASIADPIIAIVEDGVILDVRPVVSADRRFITLELRPTVAELVRPIRTITTSLGNTGNPVTIQLPELNISRARTSVPMPDGGTVLLGGFKVHEGQDLRSGVPFLNKIPIVSFFFERKGNFQSNRKLLILLKASIIIPQEFEPTPAQLGLDQGRLAPN
ncbi:MAG: hypothetical protein O7B99_09850 [Planctomycetota bacterium]|nr:hypothetical protein [Planctomycetota bacterium]